MISFMDTKLTPEQMATAVLDTLLEDAVPRWYADPMFGYGEMTNIERAKVTRALRDKLIAINKLIGSDAVGDLINGTEA